MTRNFQLDDNSDSAFIFNLGLVVGANPERVYQRPESTGTCAYVHGTEDGELCDGCLIGTVLVKMGVPRQWFIDYSLNANTGASVVMAHLGFSERIRRAADAAQAYQDGGDTWIKAARVCVETYKDSE